MRFVPPEELYDKNWFERHKEMSLNKIQGVTVHYHMLEGYIQCPRSVLYKNVCYEINRLEGVVFNSASRALASRSADLLGKSLMVGLQKGEVAANDYYTNNTYSPDHQVFAELVRRLNLISCYLDVARRNGYVVEFEKPLGITTGSLLFKGRADIVLTRGSENRIVEIKCTGNPKWVKYRSGQCNIYAALMRNMGFSNVTAEYLILPPWTNCEGEIVKASAVDIIPSFPNQNLSDYRTAYLKIIESPINPEDWPCPQNPITRCKTCPCKNMCWGR